MRVNRLETMAEARRDGRRRLARDPHRLHGRGAAALRMIAAGYRFVTLASDTRHLAPKAAEEVAAVRKGVSAGVAATY